MRSVTGSDWTDAIEGRFTRTIGRHEMDLAEHWEKVWSTDDGSRRSWHQADAGISLRLIRRVASPPAAVIDVGAGTSHLVDGLLEDGFDRPTVVDVAQSALDHSRRRLGDRQDKVDWVVADVTRLDLHRSFEVWHDRAVLHFLTDASDRRRYVAVVLAHLDHGGHAIIGTFSPNGPTSCSGLDIHRYDVEEIEALFGADLLVVHHETEQHTTPNGVDQEFTWAILKRIDQSD